MSSSLTGLAARLLIAIPILIIASNAYPEELPEGITVSVIAEYPSSLPILETVRLLKVVQQPGAAFVDEVVLSDEYCWLTKGILTSNNLITGETVVYGTGSHWTAAKGLRHTTRNTGDVEAVMWVLQLVEKGKTKEKKM